MKTCTFSFHDEVFNGTFDSASQELHASGRHFDPTTVKYLPPIKPSKILCIGINYHSSLRALHLDPPHEPLIRVMKPASCLIGNNEPVVKPNWAGELYFEAELGVIIGSRCRNVKASQWKEVIGGYTIFNDIGVRDFPPLEGHSQLALVFAQLIKSKASDTFGPIGPWIEDDLDPNNLRLRSWVNGEQRQDATTAEMVFRIPELIEYITSFMTLEPGDLISTGTPAGVGPINPGDTVSIEIENIGRLENPVVTG
jgi:5-oxopent-3-ene-1,2,5-tricarboxylate decarboxylase/2-hydroxyhepta-2,4-diene-1,7-dioate isomerase